ncbi:MAG: type 1 glutamine amidotransferase [Desulfuromonas sp.]|nr:type 1 glutamine amidotransferase [Desulfuromonas sp.]
MLHIIQSDPEVPVGVLAELLIEWQVPFRILRADLGEGFPPATGAVIILGGAMGVHDEDRHPFLQSLKQFMAGTLAAGTPLFGICLGAQLLAEVAGGMVSSNSRGEKGLVEIGLTAAGVADPLFAGVDSSFRAFQWHNDSFAIPPGALHLAASTACPRQAFRIGNAWGVQFHPEVDVSIIAAWSRKNAADSRSVDEFIPAEPAHRALCRQLLANFLAVAGLRTC